MPALEKLRILFDHIDGFVLPSAGGIMFLLYLARTLGTGVASVGRELEFARNEEPREYWALALLAAVAAATFVLLQFSDAFIALGLLEFV